MSDHAPARSEEHDSSSITESRPIPHRELQPADDLPRWKVLLHNDEKNYLEHVIRTIEELTPLNLGDAMERTFEAHENGVSLLLITHQERAELYADQFHSKNLTVTIEPDD
ncbi:MAG: ATP-dependent Clp protease adaptor ClpS [Phycisphaeraceae bacterium]|nr:ATP-dependent Clp protease adaptor ClpS [Phycisphaeraceae bacterium]